MLELNFKKLSETMTVPTKAHSTDACFDLYADITGYTEEYTETTKTFKNDTILIQPHKTVKVHTGFATNIPYGYWGAIFARSGLATKNGLRPANCVAVIDEPYTGEWIVPIHNDLDKTITISHGDRIAQFMLLPYFDTQLIEVDELESTDRGEGGFGSSGT